MKLHEPCSHWRKHRFFPSVFFPLEPRKKGPWLVGWYRGLYCPVIYWDFNKPFFLLGSFWFVSGPGEPVSGVNSPSLRVWLAPYHWKMDGKGRGSFPSLLGWFFVRGEVFNFRGVIGKFSLTETSSKKPCFDGLGHTKEMSYSNNSWFSGGAVGFREGTHQKWNDMLISFSRFMNPWENHVVLDLFVFLGWFTN